MQCNKMGKLNVSLLTFAVLLSYAHAWWGLKIKSALTYNTALTEHLGLGNVPDGTIIPDREARRDAIIDRLKHMPASVMCLQEVFFGSDVAAIVDALGSHFPYSHSTVHDSNGHVPQNGLSTVPACDAAKFMAFGACFQASCSSQQTRPGILGCIAQYCFAEFSVLSEDCWSCILYSGLDITEVGMMCSGIYGPGPYRRPNKPGLLLLSTTPLSSPVYVDFHPGTRELFERGYIEAEVGGMGKVVCSHTSFVDPPVPGPYLEFELQANGIFANYTQQNLYEVAELAQTFGYERRVWVIGDFNVGPEWPPNVYGEAPENYAVLADVLRTNPVWGCTFCSDVIYNGYYYSVMIDHLFYKGCGSFNSYRVLENVEVDGMPVSDHFGVFQWFLFWQ